MSTVRYFKLFEMQQLKLNSTGTGRNRQKCENGRGPNRAKYHTFVTGIADPQQYMSCALLVYVTGNPRVTPALPLPLPQLTRDPCHRSRVTLG